jgi:hypothetical protein
LSSLQSAAALLQQPLHRLQVLAYLLLVSGLAKNLAEEEQKKVGLSYYELISLTLFDYVIIVLYPLFVLSAFAIFAFEIYYTFFGNWAKQHREKIMERSDSDGSSKMMHVSSHMVHALTDRFMQSDRSRLSIVPGNDAHMPNMPHPEPKEDFRSKIRKSLFGSFSVAASKMSMEFRESDAAALSVTPFRDHKNRTTEEPSTAPAGSDEEMRPESMPSGVGLAWPVASSPRSGRPPLVSVPTIEEEEDDDRPEKIDKRASRTAGAAIGGASASTSTLRGGADTDLVETVVEQFSAPPLAAKPKPGRSRHDGTRASEGAPPVDRSNSGRSSQDSVAPEELEVATDGESCATDDSGDGSVTTEDVDEVLTDAEVASASASESEGPPPQLAPPRFRRFSDFQDSDPCEV